MTPSPPQYAWASTDDWAAQKDYITRLWDENKTLKEIIQIMQDDHQFYATVRMYKARFQKWGIEKKIKAEEAIEIFRQQTARAAAGKSTVAYVRGRRIDPDRLQRYRYRAAPGVSKRIMRAEKGMANSDSTRLSQIICRTPSPSPSPETTNSAISLSPRVEEPTVLRIPHECMQILRNFIAGGFETGLWQMQAQSDRAEMNGAFNWQHYVASSQGLIRHGRLNEGFSLLGICFDQYKQQLQRPDSFFWLATYKAAIVLAGQNGKLGNAFIDYASKLTSLVLPPRHPFNLLWSRMMITGIDGIRDHAGAIFESYLDMWGRHVNSTETNATNDVQGAFVFIQLHCTGLLSFSLLEAVVEHMIVGRAISREAAQFLLQETKFRLALAFLSKRQVNKAENTTNQIISWLDLQPPDSYKDLRCKAAWLTFEIKERKGTQAEALQAGHGLLKLCADIYGPTHIQTLEAMAAVEKYCRRIGVVKGAERMAQDFDVRWRAFRDLAQSRNGFPHEIEQPWYYRSIELGEKTEKVQETVALFERCLNL
ncbi:hypothetical protein F4779DRAFT_627948 [Xylariaceae sp. FL0662B]|nr:hypothetical protein F4779DRAFT_627948 [Xylariaceae sp. FL0662B]